MKFYVINKPKGSYAVEADDIKKVTIKDDVNPFMIVAADKVADGEIYQAIQIHDDEVQINFKRGTKKVAATTIMEALGVATTPSEPSENEPDVDVTEAIANVITGEKPVFVGNYTPAGNFAVSGNNVDVSYEAAQVADGTVVMNDFARFLGSLHEQGVTKVTCDNVEYTWDEEGTLKGSNFVDANGTTLISVVVAAMKPELATGIASGNLEINGKTITYTVKVIMPETEEEPDAE